MLTLHTFSPTVDGKAYFEKQKNGWCMWWGQMEGREGMKNGTIISS